MKRRNKIAMLAAAGLVIAGAAVASPATAGSYSGFSIAAPGYVVAPVTVHSRAPIAYGAPYYGWYGQSADDDSSYSVPSHEGRGPYYFADPLYYGTVFHSPRPESYHRENFQKEDHGHQPQRWNNDGRHGDRR